MRMVVYGRVHCVGGRAATEAGRVAAPSKRRNLPSCFARVLVWGSMWHLSLALLELGEPGR